MAEPERPPGHGEETAEQDDAVIGRAFRLSLLVAAVLVAVIAVLLLVLRTPQREAEAPAALAAPAPAAPVQSAAQPPPVAFTDVTAAAGIDFVHENGAYGDRLLPETMGSGVAFFDYDNDGDADLLLVNSRRWPWREAAAGAPRPTQRLYRNRGDGGFEDVTAAAGLDAELYGMGVAAADYDGDGWRDVFVTAVGENRLWRNRGDGSFEDVTAAAGVAGDGDEWSTSAAFVDYDRDGDLDLFVANYVQWSREIDFEVDYRLAGIGRAYGPPTNYAGTDGYLYRNDGDGRFSDVSADAGIQVRNPSTGQPAGKGLAVAAADLDGDGWPDLVVANDTVGNFFFRNRGNGSFEEIGAAAGVAFDNSGSATGAMGVDVAWHNNDDDLAIAIGNFANEMTSFYVAGGGGGVFTDEAIVSGIGPASRRALSFGLFFFDYDLDGRLDLLQTNGHVEDEINRVQPSQQHAQPTQLFWNCGVDCPRNYVAVEAAGELPAPAVGRGAAYADYDGDGDLDVVLTQAGGAPRLLRNEQSLGHRWVRLLLAGRPPNRDAIGALVELRAGGSVQRRRVSPFRSYLSQVELPLTFGLGAAEAIERVRVTWPSGAVQVLEGLAPGRLHRIEEPAEDLPTAP